MRPFLILTTLLLFETALAKDKLVPLKIEHLHIELSYAKSALKVNQIRSQDVAEKWTESCEKFGNFLIAGKGPFGLGIFNSFDCGLWKKKSKLKPRSWLLKVTIKNEITQMALYPNKRYARSKKGRENPITSLKFKSKELFFDILKDRQLSQLISFYIIDSSPMMLRINEDFLRNKMKTLTLPETSNFKELPQPPQTLEIYKLRYSPKKLTWIPEAINVAVRTPSKRSDKEEKPISWKLKKPLEVDEKQFVYAHDEEGSSSRSQELEEKIKKSLASLNERKNQGLLDEESIKKKNGYIGVRYGLGIFPGDVIGDATVFGLIAEIHAGIFDGFKFYYDYWPKVTGIINGEETNFGGSRTILGWSFGWDIPTDILTGIDFTPKIGVWNFETKLVVNSGAGQTIPLSYNISNAPSIELEIGLESAHDWILIRGWGTQAISLLNSENRSSVSTSRMGADLFITGPKISSIHLSFLLFAFGERVTFKQSEEKSALKKEDSISQIFYTQGYAGGGFALSW